MKKIFIIFFLILAGVILMGAFAWVKRANITAQFLSYELGVPVKIHSLGIFPRGADISQIWVGNPSESRESTAFSAKRIQIGTTFAQLVADPLLIDEIVLSDVFISVEYYNKKKTNNNWSLILGDEQEREKKKALSRDYLIRTLRLDRMEIVVVAANGSRKVYTLPSMEFHNISSATGFPISEIEKAIMKQILQGLIQQLDLNQLFNGALPIPSNLLFPLPKWP